MLARPCAYRAKDGRKDPAPPGAPIVRDGTHLVDHTPDNVVTWNRTVNSRTPAADRWQIGFGCAANA
jgi:hypothetical protein